MEQDYMDILKAAEAAVDSCSAKTRQSAGDVPAEEEVAAPTASVETPVAEDMAIPGSKRTLSEIRQLLGGLRNSDLSHAQPAIHAAAQQPVIHSAVQTLESTEFIPTELVEEDVVDSEDNSINIEIDLDEPLPGDFEEMISLDDGSSVEEELKSQIVALQQQLDAAREQAAAAESRTSALMEKLARSAAEFDNYRKRISREQENFRVQSEKKIVMDFLGVMDNFERAISHAKKSQDFDKLLQGVELTAKMYSSALARHGCVAFDSIGQQVDPHYHDVLSKVDDPSVPHNSIVQEHLKGYMLQGALLRPALVVVAQTPEKPVEAPVTAAPSKIPSAPADGPALTETEVSAPITADGPALIETEVSAPITADGPALIETEVSAPITADVPALTEAVIRDAEIDEDEDVTAVRESYDPKTDADFEAHSEQ